MPKLLFLWTDAILWLLVLAAIACSALPVRRRTGTPAAASRIWRDPRGGAAAVVLGALLLLALLDSVHIRRALPPAPGTPAALATLATRTTYSSQAESLLDIALAPLIAGREASYSEPLAWHALSPQPTLDEHGQTVQDFPRLQYGGAHLRYPGREHRRDLAIRCGLGLLAGIALAGMAWLAGRKRIPHAPLTVMCAMLAIAAVVVALASGYHLLGTDRTGNDVLYQALKSIRTAFVIGSLATLATLPVAVALGVAAGYLKSWADDLIQYLYTVLSSVPNVLLIAACALMVQGYIDRHGGLYETGLERSDLRLALLCMILGLTGWSQLCRLVRAESMKLGELDFVKAAVAFGVSRRRIMWRHLAPNVMHLVVITAVLDFSGLILYEAVLSFIGVGVDPSMNSFGGMINLARSEMSRDPVVWWPFAAAFVFMVGFVLAANLFADAVQSALDPRSRALRPSRKKSHAAN